MASRLDAAATWEAIDSLTPWDRNPRRNDHAVKTVADSIRRFGFGSPIIARTADRVVIGGHTRLKAAQSLGMDKVPVRFLDLDPAEAAALALADNKLGELAEWDEGMVAEVLEDFSLDGTELGWTEDELRILSGDGWAPDLEMVEKVDENLDGIKARVVVLMDGTFKDEIVDAIKSYADSHAISVDVR